MKIRPLIPVLLLMACEVEQTPPEKEEDPLVCDYDEEIKIPLPEGCEDNPCGYETVLDVCTRTYICAERPGVCVTAWDCACAQTVEACLQSGEMPSICES